MDGEFGAMYPEAITLTSCWNQHRDNVLERARERSSTESELKSLVMHCDDDLNEGESVIP